VSRALKVTAAKFSESAKAKIEKAGGQAIVG
jgi:large subunit ribosomal protein L15